MTTPTPIAALELAALSSVVRAQLVLEAFRPAIEARGPGLITIRTKPLVRDGARLS